mmetsp:Transcript_98058/g.280570  ORF Transcript_98058/g.280570 Transcript_98058/m.280570 type:complete len:287 (-) Transcript_98058:275-1135(-)
MGAGSPSPSSSPSPPPSWRAPSGNVPPGSGHTTVSKIISNSSMNVPSSSSFDSMCVGCNFTSVPSSSDAPFSAPLPSRPPTSRPPASPALSSVSTPLVGAEPKYSLLTVVCHRSNESLFGAVRTIRRLSGSPFLLVFLPLAVSETVSGGSMASSAIECSSTPWVTPRQSMVDKVPSRSDSVESEYHRSSPSSESSTQNTSFPLAFAFTMAAVPTPENVSCSQPRCRVLRSSRDVDLLENEAAIITDPFGDDTLLAGGGGGGWAEFTRDGPSSGAAAPGAASSFVWP